MTLADITEAIHAQRVRITDHADEEAVADDLSLRGIYRSVEHGEIIEEYPSDRPFPSCLVYGPTVEDAPVHSVWAYNDVARWAVTSLGWAVLITAYRPDPERWIDCRRRRPR